LSTARASSSSRPRAASASTGRRCAPRPTPRGKAIQSKFRKAHPRVPHASYPICQRLFSFGQARQVRNISEATILPATKNG
jgi:hypothetical protein